MKRKQEIFYAKLLLFGEYSILYGSTALSVPLAYFKGKLCFPEKNKPVDSDFLTRSNTLLAEFCTNLRKNQKTNSLLDLNSFEKDLGKGIYFDSTIPPGYGLGSSGALTAAVYARYAWNRIPDGRHFTEESFQQLRQIFSVMEGFFHGTSSGFDPLSSYFKQPMFIFEGTNVRFVSLPRKRLYRNVGIFLIDTGEIRNARNLIAGFKEKYTHDIAFSKFFIREYIPINDRCVTDMINGQAESLLYHVKILSSFQLKHFIQMIPYDFKEVWQEGIGRNLFYLKLCGAGGGGYLMGFSENLSAALRWLSQRNYNTLNLNYA